MCHKHHYPGEYRDDEEMYVYDQCCENCHNVCCPMDFSMSLEKQTEVCENEPEEFDPEQEALRMAEIEKRRKEDAILKDDKPTWCIYWKGRTDSR